MSKYSGTINVQGTTLTAIESFDALDAWLTEEDISTLRAWLYEYEPLTFTMLNSDSLVELKVDTECVDTKGGKIYVLESRPDVEGEPKLVMRTTDLELVIPTLLYKHPVALGESAIVNVAITNSLSLPYNEVRSMIQRGDEKTIHELKRIDLNIGESVTPYATEHLMLMDSVELKCFARNLFVSSDEDADTYITIAQPEHPDYLDTITYMLNSSFDDTLIGKLLGLGLPYTKIERGAITEYYLRVADYFSDSRDSMFGQ